MDLVFASETRAFGGYFIIGDVQPVPTPSPQFGYLEVSATEGTIGLLEKLRDSCDVFKFEFVDDEPVTVTCRGIVSEAGIKRRFKQFLIAGSHAQVTEDYAYAKIAVITAPPAHPDQSSE